MIINNKLSYSCSLHFFDLLIVLQLVTSIPTHVIPQSWNFKAAPQLDIETTDKENEDEVNNLDDMGDRGHRLWVRSLSRLRHQVRATSEKKTIFHLMFSDCFLYFKMNRTKI